MKKADRKFEKQFEVKYISRRGRVNSPLSQRAKMYVIRSMVLKLRCLENSDLENSDLRPQTSKTQTSKTQTSKTQTSKTQTSKTQYTFDENSRMALIFPTVFDYWRADFAFF